MWLPKLQQMIVGSPWSSLSPGLDGSRLSKELLCGFIPLFIRFFSAPQGQTFSSMGHRSLNPCWCLPAWFQIQILGDWRGRAVEEWAGVVCTESVPIELGVELDVPGRDGRLCLGFSGLNMIFTWQPCFKTGLQERECQPNLCPSFPVFCTVPMHKALCWELVQDRTAVAGGDSGRVPSAWLRCVALQELGCPCCRRGQSHPWPCCPVQHRRAFSSWVALLN